MSDPGTGAYDVNIGQPVAGTGHFVLGNANRLSGKLTMKSLLFVSPVASYDFTGRSVAIAGDVNGDGYDDLIVGVPYAARCYVLFGTELGLVNMNSGYVVLGVVSSDLTGWSVSGAGDMNNDTLSDIIIGAPGAFNRAGIESGAAYVLYGDQSTENVYLADLKPSRGFAMKGASSLDRCGLSVSNGGELVCTIVVS